MPRKPARLQHVLFLDGVYVYRDDQPSRFLRVKAPDKNELEALVQQVSKRVGRCLQEPAPRAQRVLWVWDNPGGLRSGQPSAGRFHDPFGSISTQAEGQWNGDASEHRMA